MPTFYVVILSAAKNPCILLLFVLVFRDIAARTAPTGRDATNRTACAKNPSHAGHSISHQAHYHAIFAGKNSAIRSS